MPPIDPSRRAMLGALAAAPQIARAHASALPLAPAIPRDSLQQAVPLTGYFQAGFSDVQMLNAAIAAANAGSAENVPGGLSQGTTIDLPQGRLLLDGPVAKPTRNGRIHLRGQGDATELVCTYRGTTFNADPTALAPRDYEVRFGISDCFVDYRTTQDDRTIFLRSVTSVDTFLRNVRYRNVGTLAQLGDAAAGKRCSGFVLDGVVGTAADVPMPLIDCQYGSGLVVMPNCSGYVEGPSIATLEDVANGGEARRTSRLATRTGRSAFRFGIGDWDSFKVAGKWLLFDHGVSIDAGRGVQVKNGELAGTELDYCGVALSVRARADGLVGNIVGRSLYLVGWNEEAVRLMGEGALFNIDLAGVIGAAGTHGVEVSGAGASFVKLAFGIFGAGRLAGRTSAGISVHDGPRDVRIQDCAVQGAVGAPGEPFAYPWLPDAGLRLGPDLDRYEVTGNAFRGETTAYDVAANARGSTERRMHHNRNSDYARVVPRRPSSRHRPVPHGRIPRHSRSRSS